jgi:hypothetical protein
VSPDALLRWEGVLRSQVAVSLLLLAALVLALAWGWSQAREIRRLQREMRDYLLAQADLGQVANHMREVIALTRDVNQRVSDGTDGAAGAVVARTAG